MLRQALILAAGRGRPVADPDMPNCLATVGGMPLLARTLGLLARCGIRRVGVTVGWQGVLVRRRLEDLRDAAGAGGWPAEVQCFENPDWDRPNGLSVLAARRFITEPTLLLMADQIAAPALIQSFATLAPPGGRTVLGIDRDLSRVFDIDDATKVALVSEPRGRLRVAHMGKELTDYAAVSTSLFVMAPSLLEVLDRLPEPSLTQGVAAAAAGGLVDALDVTGAIWQDVDSAEMRLHAEWLLRAYGEELARPTVQAQAQSPATQTLALIERLLAEKDSARYALFNPGPVMTSTRVKAALVHHDVCHRDEDYTGVVRRLQTKLRPVFNASDAHDILLVTGSGTAAMETALLSAVPEVEGVSRKILTISNGAFGERLGDIIDVHGLPHRRMRLPWGEPMDPGAIAEALRADAAITTVAMIRHETSVGLLNPVAAVGRLCAQLDRLLVVDAVSALGAEELDVQADGIDVCFSSSNKCLHAVAGVSFLCVSPRLWARTAGSAPRGYYLDLARYRRAMQELGQTPFTPAVSTFFALETALDELAEQGGVPARREVYRQRNLRIRRVLTSLGFQSATNTGRESVTISTVKVPPGVGVQALYDQLKERGFVIYKAKGPLSDDHIQIANMGEIPESTLDAFLAALTEIVEAARAAATPRAGGRGLLSTGS
jgi:2-aminoethylphosphonate-pyruvate transaminase